MKIVISTVGALAAMAFAIGNVAALAGGPGSAPEPNGLWTGAIHGYTPSTLRGAKVINTDTMASLVEKSGAMLIDVSEADHKPDTLPAAAIWKPVHRSIPGAVWLPGAASGTLSSEQDHKLRARVDALTGGDKAKLIITFCHPDCWGSWNMGKRLVQWGYTGVNWYPEGIDGWQQSDRDTQVIKADRDWAKAIGSDSSN